MDKIGVLAVQGDFAEHAQVLRRLDVEPIEVRLPQQLHEVKGLIIPGGESTTITKMMALYGLTQAVKSRAESGMPVWGTCAGLIVVCQHVVEDGVRPMELIDLDVRRNGYGRQVDSFETELSVPALGEKPFHAVFIRAPIIERLGSGVESLAELPESGS
ncbi:MAG: pyridoxal 5'-phosphate synthase glutaminase subunit PdxT, partial [Dehalococcoidia bacterium]